MLVPLNFDFLIATLEKYDYTIDELLATVATNAVIYNDESLMQIFIISYKLKLTDFVLGVLKCTN